VPIAVGGGEYSVCELGAQVRFKEPLKPVGTVAELFAGVGGFRLGLAAAGWKTVFSNQWEPSTKSQHASQIYVENFGPEGHSNEDIAKVKKITPEFDLLVGGFPCQDYSVAKSKSSATGLEGKKGVLWWEILRLTKQHRPKYLFLENVDRLLKSPSNQRGRDFAVMLSSLGGLGYSVEWRVINAADYGFAQRRRRVFIVAYKSNEALGQETMIKTGVLAKALPVTQLGGATKGTISKDLVEVSEKFGLGLKVTPFDVAGAYHKGQYVTAKVEANWSGARMTLGDVLLPMREVPESFLIDSKSKSRWEYLKGAKSEDRTHSSGFKWKYTEGSMVFPDPTDKPSRTVLTGEGGSSPSRFKHVVAQDGYLRRLLPIELERLNGFPDNWTKGEAQQMSDVRRAFFMGNALVVGLVERVGRELAKRHTRDTQ
jgi:DNA (cytosine-5)-methyltransferase 1